MAPVDSGQVGARMGNGPTALAGAGAAERLRRRGHVVTEQVVLPSSSWRAELATGFELNRLVSAAVSDATGAGEVPVLLAGNCNTTLGVLAGLSGAGPRLGLLWLDAHGDFNTPDEDTSGFLDGQGLAIVVGRCWRALAGSVPGFSPLPERDVVLVGARDLSQAQVGVLERSALTWLRPDRARRPQEVGIALDRLAARVDAVHFHVDLDVHDPRSRRPTAMRHPTGCRPPTSCRSCCRQPSACRSCRRRWPPTIPPTTSRTGCGRRHSPSWTPSPAAPRRCGPWSTGSSVTSGAVSIAFSAPSRPRTGTAAAHHSPGPNRSACQPASAARRTTAAAAARVTARASTPRSR
ncbi:arginase family protein [Blastococcus brunescens]|uniref:Arginase family protein n=1 Tax=Blastococcus brunescens TaxID=1564165 RepID=A0ABZ1BA73_9ACTN|nr:arginase family protein [Blastococcus sp. BMG 8361]WRL66968.1 arginase family protein [Blastococcus sp. BMG 8361]